jgi:hypothetical protein
MNEFHWIFLLQCRINIVNENGKRGMGKQKMEKFDKRQGNKTWKAKG